MANRTQPPTIKDLRVKVCYVCQEEEQYDSPNDNPQTWVHPCKCTLVAHEQCLLKWIRASQTNKPREPVKCPQCGFVYEWESDSPLIFHVLDAGNTILDIGGKTIVGSLVAAVVGGTFTGAYVILTAYGAYALKQFFGKEMYDLVLTSDYRRWPYTAFLNLPMIPVMLLLSRGGFPSQRGVLETILGLWPASASVLADPSPFAITTQFPDPWQTVPLWPPPITIYAICIVPVVRQLYQRVRRKVMKHILGDTSTGTRNTDTEFVLHLGPLPLLFRFQGREEVVHPVAEQHNHNNDHHDVPQQREIENAPELAAEQNEENARRVTVSFASIGRFVGGALLVPTISSMMGSFLLRISKYSSILRKILAIRPPLSPWELRRTAFPPFRDGTPLQVMSQAMRFGLGTLVFGYEPWSRADPVWFRNSIGLGLFALAKEAVYFLHIYLAKRELATRRVKTRNFAGIDPSTLDLIDPTPFLRTTTAAAPQIVVEPPEPEEAVPEYPPEAQPAIAALEEIEGRDNGGDDEVEVVVNINVEI